VFVVLLAAAVTAADPDAHFAAGVSRHDADPAAARAAFRHAADGYAELRAGGDRSPALALRLGRARLLAGDLPGAILAAKNGLADAPSDPGLRDLLDYARSRVEPPAGVARPRRPIDLHSVPLLVFGAAAALAVAGAVRRSPPRMAVAAVLVVTAAVIGEYATADFRRCVLDNAAVVGTTGVTLRSGNGSAYPPRLDAPLPAGLEVTPLYRRGEWVQVELPGGAVGWLPAAALRGLSPPAGQGV
jgi:hypothetical protein